jgi:hypothetical protein
MVRDVSGCVFRVWTGERICLSSVDAPVEWWEQRVVGLTSQLIHPLKNGIEAITAR